eukprot:jgi/Bigna1/90935/estExt_fgenesh1_pg.C_830044
MSFVSLALVSAMAFTPLALEHIAHGVEDNVLAASSTVDNLADAPTDLNCKETSILIPNNSTQVQIHAPDGCLDYDLSKEDPVCNGTTFPMLCKFKLVHVPETAALLERHQMFEKMGRHLEMKDAERQSALIEATNDKNETEDKSRYFTDYNALLERGMNLDEMSQFDVLRLDETGKKRVKGKHEEQYIWAARAAAKASLHGTSCKPATNGKRAPRHMDCDACWWGFIPHPCNCGCRGWTQIASLCFQPCSDGHGEYSHDTGSYCHKPCDRATQLALPEGCGIGHTRVCVERGQCFSHIVNNFVVPVAEILYSAATLGSGTAAKAALKTARQSGMKAGMKALGKALQTGARNLARKLKTKKYINEQLKAYPAGVKDRILEGGATMLLASNIPSSWGSAALEVAAVIDPTGLVGFGKSFVPPASCDDMVNFDEKLPGEGKGPDKDAMDSSTSTYDPTFVISQTSRLLKSNVECADQRNEFKLGEFASRHQCAEACAKDHRCASTGTFIYGYGDRRGHCWSEGVHTCKRFKRHRYNYYTIKPIYKEKENVECAEQHNEHDLGWKPSLEECFKACKNDAKCSQYGTFIYGKGRKAGRCWSEGLVECGRWERDQYDFYRFGAPPPRPRPCLSAFGGGKKLQNGCPEAIPFQYPKNNRCFEKKNWTGRMCNIDPENDPLSHQRNDHKCCTDNMCLPEFGGGHKLDNGCPARFPFRYPHNNRCFGEKWGGGMCNVDPAGDPLPGQRYDKKCCFDNRYGA